MTTNSAGLIGALTNMVNQVKTNILKKFRAFYLKRIHEVELAPTKTFSYDFEISSGGTAHRRSVSKLKALVVKYIQKNTPAVTLAEREFMPTDANSNMIRMDLFSIEIGQTMPRVNEKVFKQNLVHHRAGDRAYHNINMEDARHSERLSRAIVQSTVQYLEIHRYVKYLQYLARKNGVPVHLNLSHTLMDSTVTLKHLVQLTVTFAAWLPVDAQVEQRLAAVRAGRPDDTLFSSPLLWHPAESATEIKKNIVKFFIHLDKALQVVNTLTRKIDYGYNAFNFRTA